MAQLCTSAPPITNEPLMAPTCINASLHTQNALNQLKWSVLLTHSQCTQATLAWIPSLHSECTYPTQIKCSMNQVLYESNVHKYTLVTQSRLTMLVCTSNASKHLQIAPIQDLCTSQLQMAFKTSKLLQSSSKLLQGSKIASKNLLEVKTCTSNKHETSRSLSMHTSNQTSNDATHMSGPITCWNNRIRGEIAHSKHIDHTSMWTMLGVRYPTLLQPCSLFPSLYHHIDKPYGINISLPPYSNMLVVLA
jgi:hypothetical protein